MKNELLNRIFTSIILLPVLFYAVINSGIYLTILLILVYFLAVYEIIKNTKNLLFIFLSNLILILAFFSFYYLRGNSNSSLIILYWVLASTFLSDIGGYVVGRIIKGKKLTKISPNKTYSGAVGSIIFSFFALPFLNILQNYFFGQLLVNLLQFNYILLTILISIICQLGDLYISYWKRKIKIKDISNILPGHGGILDRIDGLIFVLIFSFILNIVGAI